MRPLPSLLTAAVLAAALLPAAPAAATHPCQLVEDGRVWDHQPSGSHDGCDSTGYPAVSLGTADKGRTVAVRVGELVSVSLVAQSGERWADVEAGDAGALFRARTVEDEGTTTALFLAQRTTTGEQLTATTDTACLHGEPACAVPQRSWSVTVVVTEGTSPAGSGTCRSEPRQAATEGTVDVTEAQAGGTVTVRVGSRVRVHLRRCESGGGYRPPSVPAGGPLFRERAVLQQPGSASAVLLATRVGTTVVTAEPDAPCEHRDPACAPLTGTWSLTVRVVEATPPGSGGPCAYTAIPSGTDYETTDKRVRAGGRVTLAFSAPSATSTVRLTRLSPEPAAVVRESAATGGRVEWTVAPTVNTVLEVSSPDSADDCPRIVRTVFVAPAVTLSARRNAARDYTFTGRVFPARGQAVTLYRSAADGSGRDRVRLAQTRVGSDGTWRIDRRFLGSGQFLLHAEVPASPTNVAGSSPERPTVIH